MLVAPLDISQIDPGFSAPALAGASGYNPQRM